MKKYNLTKLMILPAMLVALFFSCTTGEDDIDPNKMNFDYLSGKWSITKQVEKLSDNTGNLIETETFIMAPDMFTVEFITPTSGRVIQVEEGMWADATWSVNKLDSMLHIAFSIGDEDIDVQLKILSLTATEATLYEEDTDEVDGQPAVFENTITFKKNGDNIPTITQDVLEGKWSLMAQAINFLVDENDDGEFNEDNEVMMTMDLEEIPFNRITKEFKTDGKVLSIDSYMESEFDEISEWELLDGSNLIITDDESSFLVHITALSANSMEASFINYDEENDGQGNMIPVKMIGNIEMNLNNGEEPSLTATDMSASWELAEVKDYKDGVLEQNSDAPIGAILTFANDGSGTMVMGQEPIDLVWQMVDKSNFTLAGQFDGPNNPAQTMLFNIESFDDTEGDLRLVQGRLEMDNDTPIFTESKVKLQLVQ